MDYRSYALTILHSATYPTLSGANQSLLVLMDHESIMGNRTFCITPYSRFGRVEVADALEARGLPHKAVRSTFSFGFGPVQDKLRYYARCVVSEFRIAKLMMKLKPDVYHINTVSSFNGYVAAKLLRVPVVWHIREFVQEDYRAEFFHPKMMRKMLCNADALIAISESVRSSYKLKVGRSDIELVYNGIDPERFLVRDKSLLERRAVRLGLVGRMIPAKGHRDAIMAIGELTRRGFDRCTLDFFGAEPEYGYVEGLRLLAEECGVRVGFHDFTDDMQSVYGKLDIVLVCSKSEPFGRVTIEAMLSKCVVVGADSGGTSELINHMENGLLYHYGDHVELADAIQYVAQHPEDMRKMAAAAQSYALSAFSASENAARVERVYRDVLEKRKNRYRFSFHRSARGGNLSHQNWGGELIELPVGISGRFRRGWGDFGKPPEASPFAFDFLCVACLVGVAYAA